MSVTYLLVHSPLVGPATWDALAADLRADGHRVTIPDLRNTLEGGPPYCARQVAAAAAAADHERPVLVGHSGAGPLLPAIGSALGSVAGYVFVDAGLPTPGRSWADEAPPELVRQLRNMATEGWLPRWSRWWDSETLAQLVPDAELRARFDADCPRLPMAMFEESRPVVPGWPDAPCAYLQLSEAYREQAERGATLGWPVTTLASDHLALLTDPHPARVALLELTRRISD
ncbi:alpha/beta fold hydrolase [Glutamicibacter sp. X7]